jgi:tetratricopeptide (TPR) repeat protein
MSSESPLELKFEIGHVLFIDIVGYSKLLINEQSEQIQKLKEIVRGTEQFRLAEAEGKLLRLPTGDGGALVFRNSLEAPVLCALEITKELQKHPGSKEKPQLRLRMGIHSGPVNAITDLNGQANVAGAGINVAQRVMDCGDAGHILLSKRVADDLEHYPQWRSLLHEFGECEVKHGLRISLLNLYLQEDGKYALAYAGLSDADANLGYYGSMAPIEGRRKAEEAARKALELDDNLAEAHVALGLVYIGFAPSNFAVGDRELRHAIELNPNLAVARYNLGLSFIRQGRLDEASAELAKARGLDPISSIIARAVVIPHYFKRDYPRAFELLRQANELGPPLSATWEIGLYIKNGSVDEAFAEIEKAKAARKDDPLIVYSTGMAYAAAGKKPEALEKIKELEALAGGTLSTAHWIAKIYATLNDKEQAFSWLDRGLATGALGVFYKDEPIWDPIREDPRFEKLVAKLVMPQTAPTQ